MMPTKRAAAMNDADWKSGDGSQRVLLGDAREVMRGLPSDSFHSCVTDPPYELGFMGKAWDGSGVAFDPATWREVLRVLRPGAYVLAFGGSRTFHRLMVAIEDAGFEIRDTLLWLYGSGFPKGLDVSKAIDKTRSEDREPTRELCRFIRAGMDAAGLKSADLVQYFGGCNARLIDHWAARDTDSQPNSPTLEQWFRLKELLKLGDDKDELALRLIARKGTKGDAWRSAEVLGEYERTAAGFNGERFTTEDSKIRAATETAKAWEGWGTGLKPAFEPIILARKPLEGTVVQNVLKWGCGALNIAGCRVGAEVLEARTAGQARLGTFERSDMNTPERAGRWPANVLHDGSPEVVAMFPSEVNGAASNGKNGVSRDCYGEFGAMPQIPSYGDSGSAARFFWSPKASQAERPEHTTDDGRTIRHPTVKPLELMRYLARLVTPPGGTILEPFAGSGTTIEAAWIEHCRCTGIEIEAEHLRLIAKRMADAAADLSLFEKSAKVEPPPKASSPLRAAGRTLFGGDDE